MPDAALHIFGIRHHGPGSARSLLQALTALAPDCLLIEGPPEAEEVLALAAREDIKPPVALLIYDPEQPRRAAYFPFALFSPEWQAIQYGLAKNIPVRFMDLPQSIQAGIAEAEEAQAAAALATTPSTAPAPELEDQDTTGLEPPTDTTPSPETTIRQDPLMHLARAAGYSDSERWWEHLVEHRRDGEDIFAAILEAITALRDAAVTSGLQQVDPVHEQRREAWMRQTIRAAQKEGFQRIAVVCGAWHAPALARLPPAKDDAQPLKGLPKRKMAATWIPWTYSRLASASGYGAGVTSPGWYDFLWRLSSKRNHDVSAHWLTRVARLLRGEDLDASSASIIEAVRLAEALAALRGHPLPGLPELNEATQTVLCFGEDLPLRLISQKLIVSERLGEVPEDTPMVPLTRDLSREQKRLRLPPEAALRELDLDLRKPNDLDRSHLLHRLKLLDIDWGEPQRKSASQQGTFHELWRLQWQPEFAVPLIEAGIWGNTLAAAAAAKVRHTADTATELPALTALLDSTLLADLPEAAAHLMHCLQAVAAVAGDVSHLMAALPPLAQILRYGNVRQTDAAMVGGVVDGLVTRICIGLPVACGSLNDEAAQTMFDGINGCNIAVGLLQKSELSQSWQAVLHHLAVAPNLHGLIAGRACRLLLEARELDAAETARRVGLALASASVPAQAAAWVDGFLHKSGMLLIHDETLWSVIDDWVTSLSPDHFTATVPLLRRTFGTFEAAERRQMGMRVASGAQPRITRTVSSDEFDEARADRALPLLARMLGLNEEVKS